MKDAYVLLLQTLSPLLPGQARPGRTPINVPGEESGLVLDDGRVSRPGVVIYAKDAKGPTSAGSGSPKYLTKIARQRGIDPASLEIRTVPATEATTYYATMPVVHREVEVAALKATLLTFDHYLCGNPADRFTRWGSLEPVRAFIRDAVSTRQPDAETLHRHSLGLQYQKVGLYERLRRKLPKVVEVTPFEHVMFAVADPVSRTLDVVWWAFGFDPHGFRLATDNDRSFAYVIVNPVVKGKVASGPHEIAHGDELLCGPTNRTCTPLGISRPDEMQPVVDQVSRERREACRRAIYAVEMRCDENVIECFVEAAGLSARDGRSVRQQVRAQLLRLYGRTEDDPAFFREVDATLKGHEHELPSGLAGHPMPVPDSAAPFDWGSVLRYYRDCLTDLIPTYGLPGDVFVNTSAIVHDPVEGRQLGARPPREAGRVQ